MESSEFQSLFSANIAQNNLELSAMNMTHKAMEETVSLAGSLKLKEKANINVSLFKKCNGIIGVPISFLDKYCPEQFKIIGLDRYIKDNPRYGHRFTLNKKETYARVLIQKRPKKS